MTYRKIVRDRLEDFLIDDQISFESNRAAETSALLAGTSKKGGEHAKELFMEYGTSLAQLNQIKRKS